MEGRERKERREERKKRERREGGREETIKTLGKNNEEEESRLESNNVPLNAGRAAKWARPLCEIRGQKERLRLVSCCSCDRCCKERERERLCVCVRMYVCGRKESGQENICVRGFRRISCILLVCGGVQVRQYSMHVPLPKVLYL